MAEREIMEFVSKTIEQIKAGLPEGCGINGNFDFEVSVTVKKAVKGGINISLVHVDASASYNIQQVHKIRFSIADKKSQKENAAEAMASLRAFVKEMKTLDEPRRRR